MSSEQAIRAQNLSKCYTLFDKPADRLKQMLWRGRRKYYREFWALRDINLAVGHGEVLGIVGRNGAGKSTLLQLICGTLAPTAGAVRVNGRVAALLELGAGFNPEFSGRENVYLAAAVLGLTPAEIDARFDAIVDFSGIRDFIDQPVKTYSSGMYVRLAFSISTSVAPDILVIDEALSVGDGQFARKSFERIMSLRDRGATILFCSHSMYQVEALCNRALWLEGGSIRAQGEPAEVIREYNVFLDRAAGAEAAPGAACAPPPAVAADRHARITAVDVRVDGVAGAVAQSGTSCLSVRVDFAAQPGEKLAVAVALLAPDGRWIASSSTQNDGLPLAADARGAGHATLEYRPLLLLRGVYCVHVWLLDEQGLFAHEQVAEAARITVEQSGLEQGLIAHPHRWELESP